jgi:hypothetical protein
MIDRDAMFPKAFLVLALLLAWPGQTVAQPANRDDFAAVWREDIDFMVKGLSARGMTIDLARGPSSRGQKDFEKLYPPEGFEPAIAALKEKLPALSSADVVLELMRIHAGARVAHNSIGIPGKMGFENRLPVTFRWYADGLAIVAATNAYRQIIGTRVLRVGTMTPDELLAGVTPLIAQENKAWVREQSVRLLVLDPVLSRLGLKENDGSVQLLVEDQLAGRREVSLLSTSKREDQENFRKVRAVPPVVYAGGGQRYYWHRYLEDSRTMFVQYNVCAKDPKLPMDEFARQVGQDLGSQPIDRVVLDLRFNGGGDSRVINPLKDVLTPRLGRKVYVLIGPGTFSSAILNAIQLKRRGAILVGEPTGGTPSGYGEVKTMTLPNSKLQVRFTSKFFSAPKLLETDSLEPDILAPLTFRDALAGRDAVLEAAIAAKPGK